MSDSDEDEVFGETILQMPGVSLQYIESLGDRKVKPPSFACSSSKYFSALSEPAQLAQLLEDLCGFAQLLVQLNQAHLHKLQVSSALMQRWFVFGERGKQLNEEIQEVVGQVFSEPFEKLLRECGLSEKPCAQVIVKKGIPAQENNTIYEHRFKAFGLIKRTYSVDPNTVRFNMGATLGLHPAFCEFYPIFGRQRAKRNHLVFGEHDIREAVSGVQVLGAVLFEKFASVSEASMLAQEATIRADILEAMIEIIDSPQAGQYFCSAQQVGQHLLDTCKDAKYLEQSFLSYCFGLIEAVERAFLYDI